MSDNAETGVGELLNATGLLERVSDQALHLVPAAQGVLVGFCDQQYVTYVSGAGFLPPHVADTRGQGREPVGPCHADAPGRPLWRHGEGSSRGPRGLRRLRVTSSVCIPLCRGDEALGVICQLQSAQCVLADDVDLHAGLADVMGVAVGLAADLTPLPKAPNPSRHTEPRRPRRVPSPSYAPADSAVDDFVMNVLQPDTASLRTGRPDPTVLDHPEMLTMVFQPIVDIERPRSLSEWKPWQGSRGTRSRHPINGSRLRIWWVSVSSWRCAPSRRPVHPSIFFLLEWNLAVNVGPETIMSPVLTGLSGYDPHRIVVELTEQRRVLDYPGLVSTLQGLRESGCRFAVDDAGAGFASLSHILKLAPNFIKLDRDLVGGINFDRSAAFWWEP